MENEYLETNIWFMKKRKCDQATGRLERERARARERQRESVTELMSNCESNEDCRTSADMTSLPLVTGRVARGIGKSRKF